MENCHGRGRRWKNMDSLQKKNREREASGVPRSPPPPRSPPSASSLPARAFALSKMGPQQAMETLGARVPSPGTAPASSPEPWGIRAQSGNGAAGLSRLVHFPTVAGALRQRWGGVSGRKVAAPLAPHPRGAPQGPLPVCSRAGCLEAEGVWGLREEACVLSPAPCGHLGTLGQGPAGR